MVVVVSAFRTLVRCCCFLHLFYNDLIPKSVLVQGKNKKIVQKYEVLIWWFDPNSGNFRFSIPILKLVKLDSSTRQEYFRNCLLTRKCEGENIYKYFPHVLYFNNKSLVIACFTGFERHTQYFTWLRVVIFGILF